MEQKPIRHCAACGWGISVVETSEIEKQVEKHGEYICTKCETFFEKILATPEEQQILFEKGYGMPSEAIISEHGVFYFDGPVVDNPEKSYLGFGGSWFLIFKRVHGYNRETIVTNNLFHSRTMPKAYVERLRHAGRLNAKVIEVNRAALVGLRDALNQNPYLPEVKA